MYTHMHLQFFKIYLLLQNVTRFLLIWTKMWSAILSIYIIYQLKIGWLQEIVLLDQRVQWAETDNNLPKKNM